MSAPAARTLPFAWYSDDETLRRERDRIFARCWQYGGRAEQVAEPGSFLTTDAGGVPLLVTRGSDGELRAFLNVCRHRGAVLTEGCGRRETIQCHYHAWTYGLDGTLRVAPRSDREAAGFERDELSLVLARDLDLDAVGFHSRVEFGSNANWKVVTENFLECYHCPTAHPGFSAVVDVHPDRYVLEPHPTFSSQHCEARTSGEHGQFHLLYPNTGINVFPGPPNLSIGPIVPTGPGRTKRYLDYFFAPDADDAWLDDFFAFDEQVGREDSALVESVQRGMSAGLLEHGRLLLDAEPLIAAFQGWVADRLTG
jgi:choline monooxygenase